MDGLTRSENKNEPIASWFFFRVGKAGIARSACNLRFTRRDYLKIRPPRQHTHWVNLVNGNNYMALYPYRSKTSLH